VQCPSSPSQFVGATPHPGLLPVFSVFSQGTKEGEKELETQGVLSTGY
jgi:hypothetical protein